MDCYATGEEGILHTVYKVREGCMGYATPEVNLEQ